jgi:formylglycine-generating enzyme required for sulfatase activity
MSDSGALTEAPGTMIGHYRIIRELGRGAMGIVYLARDTALDREVALKLVQHPGDADVVARFDREAKAVARLNNPKAVTIFEHGWHRGAPFIVMELLAGQDLRQRLRAVPALTLERRLRIVSDVLQGLASAHAAGIVHRDMKPANIFVCRDGSAKVMDFGMARLAETDSLTSTGKIVGTPAYMSPDQLHSRDLDGRSDLFSVGVVLYELLVGERPFNGEGYALFHQILNEEPDFSRLPREVRYRCLEPILRRALAKARDDRYDTADSFREEIERYLTALKAVEEARKWVDAGESTRALERLRTFLPSHALVSAELAELEARVDSFGRDVRRARPLLVWSFGCGAGALLVTFALIEAMDLMKVSQGRWGILVAPLIAVWCGSALLVLRIVSRKVVVPFEEWPREFLPPAMLTALCLMTIVCAQLAAIGFVRTRIPDLLEVSLTVLVIPQAGAFGVLLSIVIILCLVWVRRRTTRVVVRRGLIAVVTLLIVAVTLWRVPAYDESVTQTGADPAIRSGTVRLNPQEGISYSWIPAGAFDMGCVANESACQPNEKPVHRVTLTRGFWMGRTEVTVAAWKRFAAASGRGMPEAPPFNREWALDSQPVVNVTWGDAAAYCKWAGGRLPTEAEWERAARGARGQGRYPWGNQPTPEIAGRKLANIADESAAKKEPALSILRGYDDTFAESAPVGSFEAGPWGLYDMAGNVWEWTADWYDGYGVAQTDPKGPVWGVSRASRGGSWYRGLAFARSSARFGVMPDEGGVDQGLRCVRDALPAPAGPAQEQAVPAESPAGKTRRMRDGLDASWIPSGNFLMGCSPRDSQCNRDEKPQHAVAIGKGFWMGRTEVTVAAYKRFMRSTGLLYEPMPGTESAKDDEPVTGVTWNQATRYCAWAGGRLPAEAEWEWAARGGLSEAAYPWGDSKPVCDRAAANGAQFSDCPGGALAPVGSFKANGYGLFDMAGNADEWCLDVYHRNYAGAPSDGREWKAGESTGVELVLRSGNTSSEYLRVSYRMWMRPYERGVRSGFRCVQDANTPP